jgi:molecular chaperone DnaK (HSP70)
MGEAGYKVQCHNKVLAPEDVSAQILDYLKNGAQNQKKISLEGTIKYAVICIPANFDNNKREATLRAGKLAGLEVLRLIEEPVAAAIAYGIGTDRDQKILVYDLGGGTFDVSILEVKTSSDKSKEPTFNVLAKEGIPSLGGDDFDKKIMSILNDSFKAQSGIDILDDEKDQGISKKKLRAARQILKEVAENAKKDLSEMEKTVVDAPNLIKGEDGTMHHLSMEITREQFNASILELVKDTERAISLALKAANLTKEDMDRVIFVGGSTRIPLVRKVATDMLGIEPFADINPDTAVALGAAAKGSTLILPDDNLKPRSAEDSAGNIVEKNKTSHFLGIEITGRRFSSVIEKDVDTPVRAVKQYSNSTDTMTSMRITIFQFPVAAEFVSDSDKGGICLGEFFLSEITPARVGEIQFDVTFDINEDGILTVSAEGKDGAGIKKELAIKRG